MIDAGLKKKIKNKLEKTKIKTITYKVPLLFAIIYFVFSVLRIMLFRDPITEIINNFVESYNIRIYESIFYSLITSIFIFILLYRHIKEVEKNKKISKLENRLNESEKVFSSFFYNNDAMMMLVEKETGEVRDVNNATCSFLGYSKEELINMSLFNLDALDSQLLYKYLNKTLDKHGNYFSTICRLANGEFRDIEVYNTTIKIKDEDLVLGIFHDVTERKKIQKELAKSEREYSRLVEMLPDAIIGLSKAGEVVYTNQSANELLGYSIEQKIEMKTIYDIVHEDYLGMVEERLLTLVEERQGFYPMVEMKGIKKNGELIDVEVKATYTDFLGNDMIIAMVRDITEKKQTELSLKKLHKAIDQSSSMVIITDAEGIVEYVNPSFIEISGFKLDEVIGKSPDLLDSKKQPQELRDKMWETISTGNRWRGELLNKRKDGQLYWVDASISPVFDNDNGVVYYVAVQSDVTDKKMMIEELELKNSQLECMLNRLKKTQTHLIQQEKLAGIGQLAAGVAHEINNPLGYIISNFNTLKKYFNSYREVLEKYKSITDRFDEYKNGSISLLISEMDDLLQTKKIDFIDQDLESLFKETNYGLDRVQEIIRGLRIFSRVDGSKNLEEYDLNEGIKNTLIIARNEIKYHAEVITDLKEIPMVLAKGGEINQVILNLIINSAHATKEKKSEEAKNIKINTYNDEKYVYFKIEDNGVGIPKENMESIFNPFFTTKPVGKGTGLGLSIAYDIIVDKHKGDIEVESEEGIGTKFTFKLPINLSMNTSNYIDGGNQR